MATEKQFEKQIKDYLKSKGIWYVKTWSNGIQRSGIPDIIACINGFFVGIEVKAVGGEPSKLQIHEIKEIRKSNGIAVVLFPDQWDVFKIWINELLESEAKNFFQGQWIFDEF